MTLGALWLTSCGASGVGNGEEAPEWPAPSPALWEATGPNGETAYLFGTIHSLPDGADWRTPVLAGVLDEADTMLVEIAQLGDDDTARTEFEARAYSLDLDPIMDRVPEGDRSALATAFDLADVDPDSMIHTENWAAALQLGNAKRCSRTQNGVDRALLDEVPDIRSLESYGEQFGIFDSLPDSAQIDLLMTVAEERGCAAGEARVVAWLTGDLETLEASINEGFRGNANLQEFLLDRRNLGYVEDALAIHAQQPGTDLLIAVGAGHMIGATGLPALFAENGYEVRRIQ